MKIKKHLVAAALAVGLAGSAGAMSAPGAATAPTAEAAFILSWAITHNKSAFTRGLTVTLATTGAGVLGGAGSAWAGAKIGGTFGAIVGGPVGMAVGAMAFAG